MSPDQPIPKRLHLRPLAPYEDRLLACLSFFRTKRQRTVQAHHCLSMYLRQSDSRILGEVGFYARRIGISVDELMELIYADPDKAQQLIDQHFSTKINEVFDAEGGDPHDIER
ncbi:hypothetical protein [Floridanema evergladense]|uniref:Uncharacterized protein n=1 Tax=Floridaenema evergladense BLCC-F167 TaxID=3153639 RepID=A0ABV4WD58_9CYAN